MYASNGMFVCLLLRGYVNTCIARSTEVALVVTLFSNVARICKLVRVNPENRT